MLKPQRWRMCGDGGTTMAYRLDLSRNFRQKSPSRQIVVRYTLANHGTGKIQLGACNLASKGKITGPLGVVENSECLPKRETRNERCSPHLTLKPAMKWASTLHHAQNVLHRTCALLASVSSCYLASRQLDIQLVTSSPPTLSYTNTRQKRVTKMP